jgi:hypothetical protein
LDAKAGQNVQLSLHFIPEWKVIGPETVRMVWLMMAAPASSWSLKIKPSALISLHFPCLLA